MITVLVLVSIQGIGNSMGLGVYVIIGQMISLQAGPSAILSVIIAGFVAILSAMCFAEFSAIAPKAGSAYIYSYISIGEAFAFFLGWNLTLEYIVGKLMK